MNRCSYNCSQSEEEEKIAPLGTDLETKVNKLQFQTLSITPTCTLLIFWAFALSVFCSAFPGLGGDV